VKSLALVSTKSGILAVARLDLAEVLRSRWLLFCTSLYGALAGLFVLVGVRESTILGFTGMSRVLLSLCHALVLLLPLLALTACGHVVNRARADGTLEVLFSHPIRRGEYLDAVTLVRLSALVVPLAVLMPLLGVLGRVAFGEPIPWSFVGRALALCAALLFCFVGVGLAVSTFVANQAKAMMVLLLLWVLGVALLDFALVGVMLEWRLDPAAVFLLAGLNPVEAARMALLSAAEPSLGTLGPVGFYLAHRLGPGALFAHGLGWPTVVGLAAWLAARRRFSRGDLI
jgi:ABC-2 type transport system permease protein